MAKTCRTCVEAKPVFDCYYQGTLSGDCAELCPHHKVRETPLLLDALAKACKQAEFWLNMPSARVASVWCGSSQPEVVKMLQDGLARYKKEMGDAQEAE